MTSDREEPARAEGYKRLWLRTLRGELSPLPADYDLSAALDRADTAIQTTTGSIQAYWRLVRYRLMQRAEL